MPAIRLASPGVAATLILAFGGCAKRPPPPPPPPAVTVATVEQRDVPVTQEWVASLYGYVDAQVRAQVSGYLLKQDYKDGAAVRAGQLLFEIDPRPFQAAFDQAQAQLAQARAQLGKAEEDVRRYGPLAKDQAISQQEMDNAVQAELGAKAQVAAGQAAVERARLDLGFTRVASPINGVAGIVQAQVGDLVGPSTGPLTTVSTLDPMKVYFPIGEQDYLALGKDQGGGFPPNAQLELILADGSVYPEKGRFYAEDRQIDPTTGTLRIAALFPNPRAALRPGQYGRVRAVIRTLPGALLVPQQALNELQGGYQVATVDGSNRVHIVGVTTGPQVGRQVVIASGLKPGERVIVDGFAKAREGAPVNPQPAR
ncbi:MAG TPA: efflux RND transporter periplasmic adaptor subunit [Opitutaceae bacterium]|nr:efflux RND transporter periplasmic adaptor subunit [Opitutaceae bacterium]